VLFAGWRQWFEFLQCFDTVLRLTGRTADDAKTCSEYTKVLSNCSGILLLYLESSYVAGWRGGVEGSVSDLWSRGRGFDFWSWHGCVMTQVVHSLVCLSRSSMLPVSKCCRHAARKVTVGLASHWPMTMRYRLHWSYHLRSQDEHPAYAFVQAWQPLPFIDTKKIFIAFSALTLLVRRQEEHPVYEQELIRRWYSKRELLRSAPGTYPKIRWNNAK